MEIGGGHEDDAVVDCEVMGNLIWNSTAVVNGKEITYLYVTRQYVQRFCSRLLVLCAVISCVWEIARLNAARNVVSRTVTCVDVVPAMVINRRK